jgi:ArsR family transcriptional regulator
MSKYRIGELERGARRFRALAHPARLHLFRRLAACCGRPSGEGCCGDEDDVRRCVGDLASDLELAPSTVSHHLKELRAAGLIRTERRGRWIDCWVEPDTLSELGAWFDGPTERNPRCPR